MWSLSGGLSQCRQTQLKTAEEKRWLGLTKEAFYFPEPHCLPGSTHLITHVTGKKWGEFKYSKSVIPQPQMEIAALPHSRLERLARGRKTTERLPAPVEELSSFHDRLPAV